MSEDHLTELYKTNKKLKSVSGVQYFKTVTLYIKDQKYQQRLAEN